jgi:hypothetical protein
MYKKIALFSLFCIAFCVMGLSQQKQDTTSIAFRLAEQQLKGYNNRDIDAFLLPYSDSVELYMYPNTLLGKGKENMRNNYAKMFAGTPDLHCTVVNRIVMGNTVIDEESVVVKKGLAPFKAIAIYTIANNKIQRVSFIEGK